MARGRAVFLPCWRSPARRPNPAAVPATPIPVELGGSRNSTMNGFSFRQTGSLSTDAPDGNARLLIMTTPEGSVLLASCGALGDARLPSQCDLRSRACDNA